MLSSLRDMIGSVFTGIQRALHLPQAGQASAPLDAEQLRSLVRGIVTTRPDEIDCGKCFEQLDRFVEETLSGSNAADAMPLVQDHLDHCSDCREEFEALLAALRTIE